MRRGDPIRTETVLFKRVSARNETENGRTEQRNGRKAAEKNQAEAKELGISYGQYRANGGKKPEDIADKYNAPVYEPEKWLGDKPIQVHQIPPGGPARIKKRVK